MKTTKLPNKLSALMRVALGDEAKAHRSPLYKVHMGWFHEPNGMCKVCFAGSVMAFTKHFPSDENEMQQKISNSDWRKYNALDLVRRGHISLALEELSPQRILDSWVVSVKKYSPKLRPQWRRDMFKIVRMLENKNL